MLQILTGTSARGLGGSTMRAASYIGSSKKCTTPLSLPATTVMGLPGAPANPQQVRPVSAMKKPSTAPAHAGDYQ